MTIQLGSQTVGFFPLPLNLFQTEVEHRNSRETERRTNIAPFAIQIWSIYIFINDTIAKQPKQHTSDDEHLMDNIRDNSKSNNTTGPSIH